MLVGLILPFYAIHFPASTSASPSSTSDFNGISAGGPPSSRFEAWNTADVLISLVCICGILIAAIADNQLYEYTRRGVPKQVLLDYGLWRYSRHPNYFGEMLWWWSVGLFGCRCGHPWVLVGAAINTLVMAHVT
eukprot:gene889-993_t